MKALRQFMYDAVNNYGHMLKELNLGRSVSPKQYGEHLQKKRKRGKRK